MCVVIERHHTGCLRGPGHHHAHVLANFFQIVDDVGVAGVKRHSHTSQVGSLRQRMQSHHAVKAVLHDAFTGLVPGEFHIALVAEHRHAMGAPPACSSTEIIEGPGGVARRVDPQHECTSRIIGCNCRQIQPAGSSHRHGDRSAASQDCTHFIGRIRNSRKQHGVAVWSAQLHVVRCGGNEFFRTNTHRNLGAGHIDIKATTHPVARCTTQRFRSDAGWVSALGIRCCKCCNHRGGWRITRRANRQINHTAIVRGRQFGKRVESVVGVRWRNKRLSGH